MGKDEEYDDLTVIDEEVWYTPDKSLTTFEHFLYKAGVRIDNPKFEGEFEDDDDPITEGPKGTAALSRARNNEDNNILKTLHDYRPHFSITKSGEFKINNGTHYVHADNISRTEKITDENVKVVQSKEINQSWRHRITKKSVKV